MGLSGALSSAITGLSAQSQAIAMVSDNLANASTTGYKTTSASFDDLVTNALGSTQYSSGGVIVSSQNNISQQGLLVTTSNATNVAIQGSGFFVVNSNTTGTGQTSYTRNGDFTIDSNGFLQDNGSYLTGWKTDAAGNVTSGGAPMPINTEIAPVSGAATTKATIAANLPADAAINATFTNSIPVYDSLGTANTVQVTWTKTAANTWTGTYAAPTSSSSSSATAAVPASTLTVNFNSDGSLQSTVPNPPTLAITGWNDGATDSSISLSLGTAGGTDGLTQFNSGLATPGVSVTSITSDGLPFGKLSSVAIDANGLVNATYSNGQTIAIYKVPVATFISEDNLSPQSNGLYQATAASGSPIIQASGTGGAGQIFGSELESSATNTNQEFSTMMTAQQAYSASAQVITAVNKMFDTLISVVSR